jgi:hypothetical protein
VASRFQMGFTKLYQKKDNTVQVASDFREINKRIVRTLFPYVDNVADTTCHQRVPNVCQPDMSCDMSDMSPNVAATCHEDISLASS